MSGRVCGKTALITGAAQGIGAAAAAALAREGARVLLTDINAAGARDQAKAINRAFGGEVAHAMHHDVASEEAWEAVVECTESLFGGLSVLVNNAGIVVTGAFDELSLDEWQRGMAVNADSVFLGCKHSLPLLRKNPPASIVNMSSISALIAAHNMASYNASKAAVWMLTKSVALRCARQGWDIRCNSIHPTFIRTPILQGLVGDGREESVMAKLAMQVPLGRLGEPGEIAQAVVYLASDESRFMTGAELKLDGGISAM